MPYFLLFITSFFLSINPPDESNQAKINVTFESASLVYYEAGEINWEYTASVNKLDIQKGKSLIVEANKGTQTITFHVTGQRLDNTSQHSARSRSTVEDHASLVVDNLKMEQPSVLNTYGANSVTVDMQELLTKKPKTLKIYTGIRAHDTNALMTNSTKVVFRFTLDYQ